MDQVITSDDAIVNSFELLAPLGKSDHRSILCNLNVNVSNREVFVKSKKILWGKVNCSDIEEIARQRNLNWDYSPAATDNGNALWQELKSKLGIVTEILQVARLTVQRVEECPGRIQL